MNIKKFNGEISYIIDLSGTAKEIGIKLSEPIDFNSGSFMNIFFNVNGEKVRRAYSISSPSNNHNSITLSIRRSLTGLISPMFWNRDMIGQEIELMGPLGLNTVDKMHNDRIYLFAFGVGVGVIKSVSDYFVNIKKVKNLTIITGSRSEDEILYKNYFNNLEKNYKNISVKHIVSKPSEGSGVYKGYIQDHIKGLDFNNSDVYICGQEKACNELVQKIKSTDPIDCNFFIEGFH